MGKVSDAKRKANNNWDAKNMKVVGCKLRIEDAEKFTQYAKERGTTVNALLQKYVFACIGKPVDETLSAEGKNEHDKQEKII